MGQREVKRLKLMKKNISDIFASSCFLISININYDKNKCYKLYHFKSFS